MSCYRLGNPARRRAATQQAKQQRHELKPDGDPVNQVVGPVLSRQFVNTRPRNQLQDVVADAVDMLHDVDAFHVPMSRHALDTTRISVVRSFKKNGPDSRAMRPPAGAWRHL
jgi:hypothetical protein